MHKKRKRRFKRKLKKLHVRNRINVLRKRAKLLGFWLTYWNKKGIYNLMYKDWPYSQILTTGTLAEMEKFINKYWKLRVFL